MGRVIEIDFKTRSQVMRDPTKDPKRKTYEEDSKASNSELMMLNIYVGLYREIINGIEKPHYQLIGDMTNKYRVKLGADFTNLLSPDIIRCMNTIIDGIGKYDHLVSPEWNIKILSMLCNENREKSERASRSGGTFSEMIHYYCLDKAMRIIAEMIADTIKTGGIG